MKKIRKSFKKFMMPCMSCFLFILMVNLVAVQTWIELDPEKFPEFMDQSVQAARQLAEEAIEEANSENRYTDIITEAQQYLEEGDASRAEGKFIDAVDKYKAALSKAKEHLKEVYLMIVADEFLSSSALHKFNSFRNHDFNVEIVAGSSIGTTADDFRTYVRNLMPGYVLLIGDYGDFPTYVIQFGTKIIESYYYYVASSLIGHPQPDIPLGLFLVENEAELSNIVDKTIFTENNISLLPKKYYAHAGSREPVWPWPVEFNEEILTEMYDRFFAPDGYDFAMATANDSTPNDVWTDIQMINEGVRFIFYHGHGTIKKWSFGLGVEGLPQLSNGIYPFVFSFSCDTGSFSGQIDEHIAECFAKNMVASANGAVAFIGAYNVSGRGQNALLEGLCNGLFNDGSYRLGDALVYAFNNTTLPNTVIKYYPVVTELERTRTAWQFHLFGDPAIKTREITNTVIDYIDYIWKWKSSVKR